MEARFPSPVFVFELDDTAQLNQALVRDIAAYRNQSPGINRSNQNGWHSDTDFFRRPEASFQELARQIRGCLSAATRRVAPSLDLASKVYMLQGWINVSGRGAYNTPHSHPGYHWSGAYYVRLPADPPARSGDIEFLDPRGPVSQMSDLGADAFAPKIRRRPKEGTIIMFPSYLRHWVYPNEQDEDRISIAFNARVANKKRAEAPSGA
jgi:uncharacterized protein (TIGR02466 family)